MPQEIERKFLVSSDRYKQVAFRQTHIIQGYVAGGKHSTVRVRLREEKGYLTIKGKTPKGSFSRYEWEKEIPADEARELLALCEGGYIDKTRYEVKVGEFVFEVDEFHGDNDGLVIAEVELASESQSFEGPYWLGEEVTGQNRYYNASLIRKPFQSW